MVEPRAVVVSSLVSSTPVDGSAEVTPSACTALGVNVTLTRPPFVTEAIWALFMKLVGVSEAEQVKVAPIVPE